MDELYILLAELHRLSPPGTPKPLSDGKKPMSMVQATLLHHLRVSQMQTRDIDDDEDGDGG